MGTTTTGLQFLAHFITAKFEELHIVIITRANYNTAVKETFGACIAHKSAFSQSALPADCFALRANKTRCAVRSNLARSKAVAHH